MTLTNEYQYIGRSNAVPDQDSRCSYYLLLYAKTSGDASTGRHTVTVKQRLVSTSVSRFYGWSTSGSISIFGMEVDSWSWQNVPAADWNNSSLTEDGMTYPCWVDLREGSLSVNVGYGTTKDINVAASWVFNEGTEGYLPQTYVTAAVSAVVTLPLIAEASRPTVSAGSVNMGEKLTIHTNRVPGSGLTHTVSYQFGNASGTIGTDVGDSVEWYPDMALAWQIPNADSGTAVISCTTYAGAAPIGTVQVTVSLLVPESIVPEATATWEDVSGAISKAGTLVQGISALAVTVSGIGAYGSTPVSSAVHLNGKAYGGGTITDAGSLTLTVFVTDSRGRVGQRSYSISVAAYTPPRLSLNASRCNADGSADDTGDHARITVTGQVTALSGKESKLQLTWGGISETVAGTSMERIVAADPNETMVITAVLEDDLVAVSRTMVLSTGYATMDLLVGGRGISFGKAATREGFDCAMPAYFSGGLYGIAADGTVLPFLTVENVTALEAK